MSDDLIMCPGEQALDTQSCDKSYKVLWSRPLGMRKDNLNIANTKI